MPETSLVLGAATPVHVFPLSFVRAIEVQIVGSALAQVPGVPACPIVQPSYAETKVTEVGWKFAGTGPPAGALAEKLPLAGLVGVGVGLLSACVRPAAGVGLAALAFGFIGSVDELDGFPAAMPPSWDGLRCSVSTVGTAKTATAATAAADVSVTASLRSLRRRARLVISSNVPEGGGSGRTSRSSQSSSPSLPGVTCLASLRLTGPVLPASRAAR